MSTTSENRICSIIQLMKEKGSGLAEAVPVGGMPAMAFSCEFNADGATRGELIALQYDIPPDLSAFWSIARSAKLFEDKQYGQWGLDILSPDRAVEATSDFQATRLRDFAYQDLVIGKFLGDSDLLLIRCDPRKDDYGRVVVALPLDPRANWYDASDSFASFLEELVRSGGDKFWTV